MRFADLAPRIRHLDTAITTIRAAYMPALKNDKFKDYTRYAEHCLNMVASTRDQELRCIHREMAAEWLRSGHSSAPS